jgi:hypothetical protein
MPGAIAAAIGGSLLSARAQSKAAGAASSAQERATELQIAESRRQFDTIRELMKPYVEAGTGALSGQLGLIGLKGPEEQKAAIDALANGENFRALVDQGEEALLANQSATGGIRGSSARDALAQFRPAMLQGLIDRQFSNLGGLASMGAGAAGGVSTAAQNSGQQVITALGDRGAAQAGAALARGQAQANMFGNIAGSIGQYYGQNPQFAKWGF